MYNHLFHSQFIMFNVMQLATLTMGLGFYQSQKTINLDRCAKKMCPLAVFKRSKNKHEIQNGTGLFSMVNLQ